MDAYEQFNQYLQTVSASNVAFGIEDSRRYVRLKVTVNHQISEEVIKDRKVCVAIEIDGFRCTGSCLLEEGNTFVISTGIWLKDADVEGRKFVLRVQAFESYEPNFVFYRGSFPAAGAAWDEIMGNSIRTK